MSANGLEVFDKTLETTHIWLGEIMEDIGPDRQVAWKVLSVVLHKLRDRLPIGVAAHLGAQLPLLVRGVYYDQVQPSRLPRGVRRGSGRMADRHAAGRSRPGDTDGVQGAVAPRLGRPGRARQTGASAQPAAKLGERGAKGAGGGDCGRVAAAAGAGAE